MTEQNSDIPTRQPSPNQPAGLTDDLCDIGESGVLVHWRPQSYLLPPLQNIEAMGRTFVSLTNAARRRACNPERWTRRRSRSIASATFRAADLSAPVKA